MPRAYSLDLRERVVAAVAAGESCRKAAAAFRVSVASVVKWSQRYRATGSAAAKPVGNRRGSSWAVHRDWLLSRREAVPDLTLRALVAELGDRRGHELQLGLAGRARRRYHLQKKPCSPPSRTAPTSPEGVNAGRLISTGSIQAGWSSSTRRGPRPI